jgi:hypothetical protein
MEYTRLGQTDLKGGLRKSGDQLVRDASPAWLRQGLESQRRRLTSISGAQTLPKSNGS